MFERSTDGSPLTSHPCLHMLPTLTHLHVSQGGTGASPAPLEFLKQSLHLRHASRYLWVLIGPPRMNESLQDIVPKL